MMKISVTGYDLLNSPRLNKGTAFTEDERDRFGLHGLLPPVVGTLEDQRERRMKAFGRCSDGFERYRFMRDLQDLNETLFYSLITQNIEQMLPVVYTPTVGEGCQRFSEIWRKPRGLFISYPNRQRIAQMLSHPRYDPIKCIVVSDGERILGLGDQGAGGMGIPIGKMALYTALGGIHPEYCLPVLLDVGTDNEERLKDPIYVGWKNKRVRGKDYDDFVDAFVGAVTERWPYILLQWEDFAGSNAARLLERYRDRLCSFNDDIQGTAAVATATLLAAVRMTGVPLTKQVVAIVGFGAAGIGIADMLETAMTEEGLPESEAHMRFYAIDRYGLLVEGGNDIRSEQRRYERKTADVQGWETAGKDEFSLLDVIKNAKPTVLIGVSGQPGAFTEQVVREMAKNTERPLIFPLSNPTSRSEAAPQDLLKWTNGTALIGTGSPFAPVEMNGKRFAITQTNNSYIFPGMALGIIASKAKRVSDGMIMAAAKALAELSPAKHKAGASFRPWQKRARSAESSRKHWASKLLRRAYHRFRMRQISWSNFTPMSGSQSMSRMSLPSLRRDAALSP
jgi:malate dehydrogenase (oxaloacetate-decarboxylating)